MGVGAKRMASKLGELLKMTKPTQLLLLSVTMYGAYFAGGGKPDPRILGLLALTSLGSAGGVTALNMYIERDIDAVMRRTSDRPLPSGKLSGREALFGVILLILVGTLSGYLINKWVMLTTLIGLYFDIIAYTEMAKRRTEWSLLFGSVAGAMPALGGWAAASGSITWPGILLAGMVYVWQPLHVAFIHYYYSEDYKRAGVPTIPGNLGHESFASLAKASVISLVVINALFVYLEGFGIVSLAIAVCLAYRALLSIRRFVQNPLPSTARLMIKYASPMLGIIFILLPIERIILIHMHLIIG